MKKLFFVIAAAIITVSFSSCDSKPVKMHIIKDNIDVFVDGNNIEKIDSTDVVVLYYSKYRTNGKWEIADQVDDGLFHIDKFTTDTDTSYITGNNEKVPEYFRLAKIKKKY